MGWRCSRWYRCTRSPCFLQLRDDLYESLDGQLAGDQALAVAWLDRRHRRRLGGSAGAVRRSGRPRRALGRRVVMRGRPALFDAGREPGTAARRLARLRPGRGSRIPCAATAETRCGALVTPRRSTGETIVREGRAQRGVRAAGTGSSPPSWGTSLPIAFAVAALAGVPARPPALSPVAAMTSRARQIAAGSARGAPARREPPRNSAAWPGSSTTCSRGSSGPSNRAADPADASHELRTPLTAIRSVGEVGLREPRTEAEYREIIGSMLEEVERLTPRGRPPPDARRAPTPARPSCASSRWTWPPWRASGGRPRGAGRGEAAAPGDEPART